MVKASWPALAAAFLLAFAPSASAATVRHASPAGGTTGTCTEGEPPCSLKYAVETVAVAGDDVVLAPGLYTPPSQVAINKAIRVHGEAGQPRPRVVRAAPNVFSVSGGGTLADVQLEAPVSVLTVQSVAERVIVLASPGTTPPEPYAVTVRGGGLLRDSIVRTEAVNAKAVTGAFGVMRLVNVTAIATDPGSSGLHGNAGVGGICIPDSMVELHATNVIARGGKYDVDVPALCSGDPGEPSIESAHMDHSNYRRSKVNITPGHSRVEDEGGNQETEPLFASPPSLDFHQLAGSATIDAGRTVPLLGSADIDGQPRIQGSAPDIGADEFVPPVPEPPPGDTTRPVASLLTVSPGRFRAATSARRRGARISYALDEPAKVTFTVKRIVTRIVRKRKRTRYVPVRGSFADAGEAGGNTIRFRGRMRGRRLKPGLYRLIALPVDAANNTGNAVLTRFRIVR